MAIYQNIRLDKGMYTSEKGLTQTLEELDPSENYIGTSLEGLDAYQRQLKRFDIKVRGRNSDMIEKFFKNADSAVLFPEYVCRAVKQGIEENDILPKIVATVTEVDSYDYRTIAFVPTESELELQTVAEGDKIPKTEIKTSENLVKLKKRGRMLVASYEAIRFQRLDLFTVTLRQIGAYIAKTQLKDAIDALVNGDGEDNANNNAIISIPTSQSGTIEYSDMVNFWNSFDSYNLNTIIASPSMAAKLLRLYEFRDITTGFNFHETGKLITPFGAEILNNESVDKNMLIGLDRTCALEQVQAGGVITEFDKLIDRQFERTAITNTCGFSKIYNGASKALTL